MSTTTITSTSATILQESGRMVLTILSSNTAAGVLAEKTQQALAAIDSAADTAMFTAGMYPDTATGLINTTDGEYFNVPSGDMEEFAILYLNVAGAAVEQKRFPGAPILQATLDAAAASADSEAAAAASETGAAGSAVLADADRIAAEAARDATFAAAQASGVAIYDTKAAANAAVAGLADLTIVEVLADESQAGARTRYRKESGSLVFKIALEKFQQSGEGAIIRSSQDKMRESVSVKDYGATGDGLTDDTAAIQLAVSVGRNVIIPKGTYLIDALVGISIVGGEQHIMLEKGAVLQAKPNNSALVYQVIKILDVADVLVTGGTIIGDRAAHTGVTGESGMGIYVANSKNITIRDVEIRDCWGDGIYVGGTGTTGKSVNVRVENCFSTNNRRQGLTIAAVDGCIVDGGKYTNTNGAAPESGIDIEPNPGKGPVNNVIVRNVRCDGNNGHGIAVSQTICTNVKLSKNTVTNNGANGIQSAYIGSDLLISGNTVTGNADNGILIQGDNSYVTREIIISDNTVKGNGETGIKFLNNIRRFTVKGNTVYGNGFNGMSFEGGAGVCDDGVVAGNNCESNSQAAHNTYDNILIGSLAHFTRFSNNVCRKGTLVNKPAYGIRATNNEANWVTDNDLYTGGETANFNGVLSNLTIQRNIGFKTENHVLSNTFLVDAVATVTVTIAHGCAYAPSTHHCQLTIVDPSAFDFSVGSIKIQSVDATNVTARVKITSAASTGNTARLALSVRRPSAL